MISRDMFYSELSEDEILWLRHFLEGATKRRFDATHLHTILASVALRIPKGGKYAEIGSHVGGSALTVKYTNREQEIYCYDLPDGGWGGIENSNAAFRRNLRGFTGVCFSTGSSHSDVIKSAIKFNGPYDVFLVDGDHSDLGAYEDLELAYANLKKGGYLVFDDTSHHPYLKNTFIRFCGNNKIKDYIIVEHLTGSERKYKIGTRGVGILRKFNE